MNRNVLIGAVLVLLAAFGYYQFSYAPAQKAVAEAAAAAKAAADEATAAADKAAADAKAATDKAAADAAAAAKEAADAAAAAATDAAKATTDAATDAASMVWDATKLTADDVMARITGAPIPQATKDTLTATFNSVKDNPSAVQMVLDQLKQAMGL